MIDRERNKKLRVINHPILGKDERKKKVTIYVDNQPISAIQGEPILAALLAQGIRVNRITKKMKEPRGLYCGIGRCTDCVMIVNGIPNVRTCVTFVEEGMKIETQEGLGQWKNKK
jgi:predicted molibdopterin-dependent oxidoreductase YjgC